MVNPTIVKKQDTKYTPVEEAKKLFQVIYQEKEKIKDNKGDEDEPKIKVSDVISKMAFYYEKIRNAVEYEEEHLLRKNAIERILKRQIVIEGSISFKELSPLGISQHLLTELIRAGYLPNNTMPETKIYEISRVIEKYLKLKMYSLSIVKGNPEGRSALFNWMMAMDATEIEENLGRSRINETVVDYLYKILNQIIVLPENSPYREDKEIQIYISIHRKFLKFDEPMVSYILFKYYNSNWQDPNDGEIKEISERIFSIRKAIDYQMDHPLTKQINRLIASYNIYFTILRDVIEEDPIKVYGILKSDLGGLSRKVKAACSARYKQVRAKLWRAGVRSIIYIFITKSIFAVLLEVPATKFFGEKLNNTALAINIMFPALLLFFIILFTRLPSESNSQKILEGIQSLTLEEFKRKEPHVLRQPIKRSAVIDAIFGLLYFITFLFSVAVVVSGLDRIGFNWVSIAIFLFFLLFVSFFSTRIRKNAREYLIIPAKDTLFNLFTDFFYIPIVSAGKWLSEKFSRINVFVFVLDFVIEAPFKIFVEIAEEWTKYVKERKDDIV